MAGNDNSESVLAEAERLINGPKREEYGGALESFALVAEFWSVVLRVPVTPEQVTLCMIGMKMARAMHNPQHRDSQVDIAGYAGCLELIAVDRKNEG
jgi:hypothetical protein